MSDMSDLSCASCDAPLERVRYFPRQLLTADDLTAEQDYYRQRMRFHNRYLHGWGVVCGCAVEPVSEATGWQVRVCPGYVVSPTGDEILINDCVVVDLQLGAQDQPCTVRYPCPPQGEVSPGKDGRKVAYVAVRFAECYSRPVRVHPSGCGCDETGCEYSRVRDSFEIKVLWELPESHASAVRDDLEWCRALVKKPGDTQKKPMSFPVPPCPDCATDPWVVLATIALPQQKRDQKAGAKDASGDLQISYDDRRVLLSTSRLQTAILCMAD